MTSLYTLANVEQEIEAEAGIVPPRDIRKNLPPGSLVKLIFVGDDPYVGERMWVTVQERLPDGRYRGELDNDPSVLELRCGESVTFGPEHVLAIFNDAYTEALLAAGAVKRTH